VEAFDLIGCGSGGDAEPLGYADQNISLTAPEPRRLMASIQRAKCVEVHLLV
jgi:hypothetical protein